MQNLAMRLRSRQITIQEFMIMSRPILGEQLFSVLVRASFTHNIPPMHISVLGKGH